ncbi:hypothetical protein B0O99DRAFT_699820 [Bisporella sp. PMI_857]|nr:hypothetical protein B0O99DRAFT_699820 [Bisporella sp. PMI_857]
MTTPNIERQREMKDLLDTVFEEVLKAFAEIDCFSKESSPSIFLVYAHENRSVGNANATWAIQLIRWLRAVRSKTFSDRSLVPGLWATREEENFASVHDVLSNQFCLLPARSRVAKGKRKRVTSVDKVIVCCSEVLQSYSKDPLMDGYTNAIKEFYFHAEKEHQDGEAIEEGIQELVRQYRNEEGFHHVITELTFLDIRSSRGGSCHDIIPIVFNGNDITYLRYFDDAQTVWLKVQDDPSMFHPCQALHKLYFKLLRRLYEDQNPSISEFEDLYWKCAQSLPSQGSLPRHTAFMETISVERKNALDRLERNAYASIRVRPMSSSQPSAIFFVPFKRNTNFVGRESIIVEIDQKISSTEYCQHVALWGLGGTGKTQIALEYAFRRKDATPDCAVFWVPAINTDTFKKAYLNIGELLKIPGISDEKADVTHLVQEKLSNETSGEWLIIVDNADDADVLFKETSPGTRRPFDLLPSSPKGSIIFTTRTRGAAFKQVQAQENIIEVTEMTKPEAEDLLKKVLGEKVLIQERETADKLLSLLAWLPLAIFQAASFIATTAIPLADYVVLFESSEYDTIQMLSVDFDDQTRYRDEQIKNPIATTWLISFEQIQKEDPLAAKYLSFMACLLRENIPQSLLPETTSKLDGIKAIGTLTAYSFLTRKANSHMFDMHRLVHLVTRNWLKDQSRLATQTGVTFSRVLEVLPYGGHKDYNVWVEYLPHAIKVASSSEEFVKHKARIILLAKIGQCQQSVGQYKVAEETHRQVLELRKSVLGEEDSSTLVSMNNIGDALSSQGKYTEAEKMYRETLALREKVLGKEHPHTLTSMSNVGYALSGQGKYTEAEKMHREALALREKVLGKEHPETLASIGNLKYVIDKQKSNAATVDTRKELYR